ncbi:MAG: hypothetical protein RL194_515 [Pseudomonadota bacterium]|jgi:hypothetical protein
MLNNAMKMMLTVAGISSLSAIAPISAAQASDDLHAKFTEESRKTAQEFMQQLAGTLKQQLDSNGTESAIKVCKEIAPALALQYSIDGKTVKRVSLKPRNESLGTPGPEETAMLVEFDEKQRSGADAKSLEMTKVYKDAEGSWLHYMKAIPTQQVCLQCHGKPDNIADNVRALLAKEYPADRATGYSPGEIRGAVSIRRAIK